MVVPGVAMRADEEETPDLLDRAREGDREALGRLLDRQRPRLARMIALRLDPRLGRRLDVSDVIQEVQLRATRRRAELPRESGVPFYLWLRALAAQTLVDLHRRHLIARGRDVRREAEPPPAAFGAVSSQALAGEIAGTATAPDLAAGRAEHRQRVWIALDALEPLDREVLALRHFEQLSNAETARALGIGPSAASKRYVRALRRLSGVMR